MKKFMIIELKKNTKDLVNVLKTIKAINSETDISFKPDGMYINVLDLAMIMMTKVKISKEFFDVYDVKEEVTFTINFDIFARLVNSFKKGFTLEDSETELIFKDGKTTRCLTKYVVINTDRTDPPSIFVNSYGIDFEDFISRIKTALDVDSVIKFTGINELTLYSNSQFEKFTTMANNSSDSLNELNINKYFAGEYLVRLEPLVGMFESIIFKLDNESPLYFLLQKENIHIEGWIAARVDESG